MTKKFTTEEKDRLILKTLLSLDVASKNQLAKECAKEKKISRAIVSKRVDELAEEGMIWIKKGPRGPVGTDYCSLKFKGFVYLILKCDLNDEELEKALKTLFGKREFIFQHTIKSPDFRSTLSQIVKESIHELRPKINFEYFNEEWALGQFSSLVDKAFWKYPEKVAIRTPEEFRKFLKRAGVSKRKAITIYQAKLDDALARRNLAQYEIKNYGAMVKLARKIR